MTRLVLLFALAAACGPGAADPCRPELLPEDEAAPPPISTPRWAFEPWISKDISDAADTYAFVEGFLSRDIPVGAVVLDSPWETNYNTFVPNPSRYPGFEQMVADLHGRGIRIVLWVTQMVNDTSFDLEQGGDVYDGPSPNHAEAQRCGFLVNQGTPYVWWKGTGAGVDFFNPAARAWWHRQQDPLYTIGIDGWKLDFGEDYIKTAEVETHQGPVPHQAYSEAYYRDFYAYGRARRGDDFVTMVRAWDASYEFPGRFYARPEHAPVAWMGDNRRDFIGLADALDHMFRSARAGYAVVGSDVGGYLDLDDKTRDPVSFDQVNFVRWVAVAALTPFMQLHGRANLEPWSVPVRPDETVAVYRQFAKLHHELVPFFHSLTEAAWRGGPMVIRPEGDEAAWPGDYRFRVGDAFLVAPILDATGVRDVALPAGERWYDFWDPAAPPRDGGQTVAYDATDPSRLPLFVRRGAIVPTVSRLLVWPGAAASFPLLEEDGAVTTIEAADDGAAFTLSLSRVAAPRRVEVRADRPVTAASLDGAPFAALAGPDAVESADGWFYDAPNHRVLARLPAGGARRLTLTAP